jgi:hypothetical protein
MNTRKVNTTVAIPNTMIKRLLTKDKTKDAKHAAAITDTKTASQLMPPNSLMPLKNKYTTMNVVTVPHVKITATIGVKATVKLTNVGIIIV